ncbi:hypothetical protein CCACVL1_28286 [Corchorus capsularis]|uniref:Uncharacterized protein n=1 Tax=Corchorus capsularis TaxID=210143 RepID=A0A1R3G707_COCAP|nr:hypothetical protein CCACVL1_28286 [Corchorus capsularis]
MYMYVLATWTRDKTSEEDLGESKSSVREGDD